MSAQLKAMSKDERSLLLYFETCAVDRGGLVDLRRMNDGDMQIAKRWDGEGLLSFSRIPSEWLGRPQVGKASHCVKLTDAAWVLAHEERRARAKHMDEIRIWYSTAEKRSMHIGPSEVEQ